MKTSLTIQNIKTGWTPKERPQSQHNNNTLGFRFKTVRFLNIITPTLCAPSLGFQRELFHFLLWYIRPFIYITLLRVCELYELRAFDTLNNRCRGTGLKIGDDIGSPLPTAFGAGYLGISSLGGGLHGKRRGSSGIFNSVYFHVCLRAAMAGYCIPTSCVCMYVSYHIHPRIIIIKRLGRERRALEARKKGGTSETLHDLFFSSLT